MSLQCAAFFFVLCVVFAYTFICFLGICSLAGVGLVFVGDLLIVNVALKLH